MKSNLFRVLFLFTTLLLGVSEVKADTHDVDVTTRYFSDIKSGWTNTQTFSSDHNFGWNEVQNAFESWSPDYPTAGDILSHALTLPAGTYTLTFKVRATSQLTSHNKNVYSFCEENSAKASNTDVVYVENTDTSYITKSYTITPTVQTTYNFGVRTTDAASVNWTCIKGVKIVQTLSDDDFTSFVGGNNDDLASGNLGGWTCSNSDEFRINTWSTEGNSDGSNMTTNFIQNFVYQNTLGDGTIKNSTDLSLPGTYCLTDLTRVRNNETVNPFSYVVTSHLGNYYEATTVDVDLNSILAAIGASDISGVTVYYQAADGTRTTPVRGNTDGWHAADGTFQSWGASAYYYLQNTDGTGKTYQLGGYPGNTENEASYSNTLVYVNNTTLAEKAITITFNYVPYVVTSTTGSYYEGKNIDIDLDNILMSIKATSTDNVSVYSEDSDGTRTTVRSTTNGWHDADGNMVSYGDESCFYIQDHRENQEDASSNLTDIKTYIVGGMPGKTNSPVSFSAKLVYVNNTTQAERAITITLKYEEPAAATNFSGLTFFADHTKVNPETGSTALSDGCGAYNNPSVEFYVDKEQNYDIGYLLKNTDFNWLAFKNITLTYVDEHVTPNALSQLASSDLMGTSVKTDLEKMAATLGTTEGKTAENYAQAVTLYLEAKQSIDDYANDKKAFTDLIDEYEAKADALPDDEKAQFYNFYANTYYVDTKLNNCSYRTAAECKEDLEKCLKVCKWIAVNGLATIDANYSEKLQWDDWTTTNSMSKAGFMEYWLDSNASMTDETSSHLQQNYIRTTLTDLEKGYYRVAIEISANSEKDECFPYPLSLGVDCGYESDGPAHMLGYTTINTFDELTNFDGFHGTYYVDFYYDPDDEIQDGYPVHLTLNLVTTPNFNWLAFSEPVITSLGDDADAFTTRCTELITTANAVYGRMQTSLQTALTTAITNLTTTKTIDNFNALRNAINAANNCIDMYGQLGRYPDRLGQNFLEHKACTSDANCLSDCTNARKIYNGTTDDSTGTTTYSADTEEAYRAGKNLPKYLANYRTYLKDIIKPYYTATAFMPNATLETADNWSHILTDEDKGNVGVFDITKDEFRSDYPKEDMERLDEDDNVVTTYTKMYENFKEVAVDGSINDHKGLPDEDIKQTFKNLPPGEYFLKMVTITFNQDNEDYIYIKDNTNGNEERALSYGYSGVKDGGGYFGKPYISVTNPIRVEKGDEVEVGLHVASGDYWAALGGVEIYAYEVDDEVRGTVKGNYGTLCLPYDATVTNATLYTSNKNDAEYVYLTEAGTAVKKGVPYIYECTNDEENLHFVYNQDADMVATPEANNVLYGTFVDINNLYTEEYMGSGDEKQDIYLIKNHNFYLVTGTAGVKAYRCYLKAYSDGSAKSLGFAFEEKEDEPTGIQDIEGSLNETIYDLSGRRIAQPKQGIYIVNGKKKFIK